MKDILKEIDMILDTTGIASGDIELAVEIVDNATFQRAKKYSKFGENSGFERPVKGLYPHSTLRDWDKNDNLKSVKVIVKVTEDYERQGE